MNQIHLSPEARRDLLGIQSYITEELQNATAAANVVRKIAERIQPIKQHAELGASLSSILPIETRYRYLICGSYLVFYYIEGQNVFVVRILYGKRDYMTLLFGKADESSEEDTI